MDKTTTPIHYTTSNYSSTPHAPNPDTPIHNSSSPNSSPPPEKPSPNSHAPSTPTPTTSPTASTDTSNATSAPNAPLNTCSDTPSTLPPPTNQPYCIALDGTTVPSTATPSQAPSRESVSACGMGQAGVFRDCRVGASQAQQARQITRADGVLGSRGFGWQGGQLPVPLEQLLWKLWQLL